MKCGVKRKIPFHPAFIRVATSKNVYWDMLYIFEIGMTWRFQNGVWLNPIVPSTEVKKNDFLIFEVNCDIADIFWKFLGLNNLFFYSLQDSQKKFCHQMALSHFSFLIFALKFKLSQNEFCSKKALEKISIFCFNIFFIIQLSTELQTNFNIYVVKAAFSVLNWVTQNWNLIIQIDPSDHFFTK